MMVRKLPLSTYPFKWLRILAPVLGSVKVNFFHTTFKSKKFICVC